MEAKSSVIGLAVVALILLVVVAPEIIDTLGTKTDDIPADSQWNSGNDLLKTLWLALGAIIIIIIIVVGKWLSSRRDLGGGGV